MSSRPASATKGMHSQPGLCVTLCQKPKRSNCGDSSAATGSAASCGPCTRPWLPPSTCTGRHSHLSPTPGPPWTLHKYGTHMDMRINESKSLFKNKTKEKVTLTFLKINPLKPLLKFFCEIQDLQFKFSLPNKS